MIKSIQILLAIFLRFLSCVNAIDDIDLDVTKTLVWGPGLEPDQIVLPARYFFIHAVDSHNNKLTLSPSERYEIIIYGRSQLGTCRYRLEQLDRQDGSIIVRYKIGTTCYDVEIHIKYKEKHVASSPYMIKNKIYPEKCYCPQNFQQYMINANCPQSDSQIINDLRPFPSLNFTKLRYKIIEKFNNEMAGNMAFCNYIVKDNAVYRQCHGKYVGFKMFIDALLLSLTRKVYLPDIEFFVNLGDWPVIKKGGHTRTTGPYPIFSWCGSEDSFDIVLPTYDITESSLETMERVVLDMLSVQKVKKQWHEKIDKAFWRGRDSRRERLDLIDIARENPDLFNASLTNFFFFRDEQDKYGPKQEHISFFKFFDYKYQINIDGTVAAYRFPYLLAGNSVVLKQESPFYEHFYKKLIPYKHYIPFKRDLSDLVKNLKWTMEHEPEVLEIIRNANEFTRNNLLPLDIYCYHLLLFKEWHARMQSDVKILREMEEVKQPAEHYSCECSNNESHMKDEL